jgi:hypothetical protein
VNVPYFRQLLLGACFAAPLALAGCSQEAGVPQSFPPLHYNYLAPISLNVSNIVTQVNYVPPADGSDIDNLSPETPLQAVQAMIQDLRAFLYTITQDMMNAENVQLEYQIRQNLGAWLVGGVSAVGGAAAPVPVQTQDLGSGSLPPLTAVPDTSVPAMPGAPTPLVPVAPPARYSTPPAPVYGIQPPAPAMAAPTVNPDTMPGGSVGLPAGNPVPTPMGADQIGAQPAATMPGDVSTPAVVPSAPPAPLAPPAPPPSSSSLPPLPPGITP